MNIHTLNDIISSPLSRKEGENKNCSRIGRNVFLSHYFSDFKELPQEQQSNLLSEIRNDDDSIVLLEEDGSLDSTDTTVPQNKSCTG